MFAGRGTIEVSGADPLLSICLAHSGNFSSFRRFWPYALHLWRSVVLPGKSCPGAALPVLFLDRNPHGSGSDRGAGAAAPGPGERALSALSNPTYPTLFGWHTTHPNPSALRAKAEGFCFALGCFHKQAYQGFWHHAAEGRRFSCHTVVEHGAKGIIPESVLPDGPVQGEKYHAHKEGRTLRTGSKKQTMMVRLLSFLLPAAILLLVFTPLEKNPCW